MPGPSLGDSALLTPREDLGCGLLKARQVPGSQCGSAANLTWVFVFLELILSASSVSEATFSRWRLVLLRGDEASSFTFCNRKARAEHQAKGKCPISLREE